MLLRRATLHPGAAARALRSAHTQTGVIGAAAAATRASARVTAAVTLTQIPIRSASSKASAAASHSSAAMTSSLPALPDMQLTYLTADATKASWSSPDLEAVALFLTEEELAGVLASARAAPAAGAKAAATASSSSSRELSIDALLSGAGSMQSVAGLFDGAATLPPHSRAWTDFSAKSGETMWLHPQPSASAAANAERLYPRLLLVGLGAAASVSMASYRSATWRAVSSFQSHSLSSRVGICLPQPPVLARFFDSHLSAEIVGTVARIAKLSNHRFIKHLSEESVVKRKCKPLQRIDLIDLAPLSGSHAAPTTKSPKQSKSKAASAVAGVAASVDRAALVRTQAAVAEATCLAREWANERGDVVTPLYMEQQARALATKHGLKITVLQDADLDKEGLQLIRAVGRAAVHKARLVVLEYRGAAASAPVTALVGKGVTFDTGGLLIKGRGNMENMHMDMAGSAAVLAVMQALPQIAYQGNVVGVLALAENAVSAESYKPLAILPSAAGTVEVQDTDAEGRLVLADAMTYVCRTHKPTRLIDLATLTGASVVALGEELAALFANDADVPEVAAAAAAGAISALTPAVGASSTSSLASALSASGERVGERLWRMPITQGHRDELKGTYSDLRNCAPSRLGGACVAAAFLERFVGKDVAWAHIDLAGPAMLSKQREWACEGGTGFGTQLLLDFFMQQQRAATEQSSSSVDREEMRQALNQAADMAQQ